MMKFFLTTILSFIAALGIQAAESGDQVIVVYNTRVPESKEVADYYAQKRHVPPNQIFGFALSTGEDMSREEFQNSLQKPLAKALVDKKLWRMGSETIPATNGQPKKVVRKVVESKIRYAVLCYGVPIRIAKDPNLKEKFDDSVRPELRRNEAAVDSDLALLPSLEEDLKLGGPLASPFYAATNAAMFSPTNGILMVTRLDGPSAAIARGLVDKAIQAESDGLWGRGYFDIRGTDNPGFKQGDAWIRGAYAICKQLGIESVLDEKPGVFSAEFPMSQIAFYCGWYDENASGPFAQKHVEFMPGAFAYHLHSFSAADLRSTTNHWVGPLLYKGATCSMGSVDEPYLAGTPDVAIFCARFIMPGFSFGEASYASQTVLSWQTTVVGDPLYRPFGRPPEQLHQELESKKSPLVDWSYLRLVNLNLAQGRPAGQLETFLEDLSCAKESSILMEKLGDLCSTQGKPASATDAYEKALKLDCSPLQRVRIRLELADKYKAADEDRKEFDDLWTLLDEKPDYPDKFGILKRQMDIATQKLKTREDITRCVQAMTKYGEEQNAKAEKEAEK